MVKEGDMAVFTWGSRRWIEVEFYREIKGMFVGGSAPAPRPYSQGGEVFQGEVSGLNFR